MPSNNAKIYKALSDRLNTLSLTVEVVEPNGQFNPSPVEAYILLDDLRFDSIRPYVGQGSHLHRGNLMVNVLTPVTWTHLQAMEFCGVIADHFTAGVVMEYDGLSIRVDKNAQVVNTGFRDGDHYRLTVQCPWIGVI